MKSTILFLLLPTMFGISIQGMEKPQQLWKEWLFGKLINNEQLSVSLPINYSIHLMWINKDNNQKQPYIYPSDKEYKALKQWSLANPEASLCLWYDSVMNHQPAIDNTRILINHEMEKNKNKIARIELRDIRELAYVKKYADVFSSQMPIYFRVDLLRAIIAYETIKQYPNIYFVYADLDVKPLNKTHIFDQETLKTLAKYKYVMAHENNRLGFENSFQIFTYEPALIKSMKEMLIKANILRAQNFLLDVQDKQKNRTPFNHDAVWQMHEKGFAQNVFYSYPMMHIYLCQLHKKDVALYLRDSNKPYDKKQRNKLDENAQIIMAKSSTLSSLDKFPIPIKKVSMPESRFTKDNLKANL